MVAEEQREARAALQRQMEACIENQQRQAKARENRELMTFQKRQHQVNHNSQKRDQSLFFRDYCNVLVWLIVMTIAHLKDNSRRLLDP